MNWASSNPTKNMSMCLFLRMKSFSKSISHTLGASRDLCLLEQEKKEEKLPLTILQKLETKTCALQAKFPCQKGACQDRVSIR